MNAPVHGAGHVPSRQARHARSQRSIQGPRLSTRRSSDARHAGRARSSGSTTPALAGAAPNGRCANRPSAGKISAELAARRLDARAGGAHPRRARSSGDLELHRHAGGAGPAARHRNRGRGGARRLPSARHAAARVSAIWPTSGSARARCCSRSCRNCRDAFGNRNRPQLGRDRDRECVNARRHRLRRARKRVRGLRFRKRRWPADIDIVVSNPPYIPTNHIAVLELPRCATSSRARRSTAAMTDWMPIAPSPLDASTPARAKRHARARTGHRPSRHRGPSVVDGRRPQGRKRRLRPDLGGIARALSACPQAMNAEPITAMQKTLKKALGLSSRDPLRFCVRNRPE